MNINDDDCDDARLYLLYFDNDMFFFFEGDPSVMVELATQLSTVLITQLTVGKVTAYIEYVGK